MKNNTMVILLSAAIAASGLYSTYWIQETPKNKTGSIDFPEHQVTSQSGKGLIEQEYNPLVLGISTAEYSSEEKLSDKKSQLKEIAIDIIQKFEQPFRNIVYDDITKEVLNLPLKHNLLDYYEKISEHSLAKEYIDRMLIEEDDVLYINTEGKLAGFELNKPYQFKIYSENKMEISQTTVSEEFGKLTVLYTFKRNASKNTWKLTNVKKK